MITVANATAIVKSFAIESRMFIKIIIIIRIIIYAFLFTSRNCEKAA